MILIISFEDNDHVERVRRHLKRDSAVIDSAWFPARLGLDVRMGGDGELLRFTVPGERPIDLSSVGAVWCRRLRGLGLHENLADETARLFAWSESNEALQGVWHSLDCFWMNPPNADEVSQRKIRQLQVARQVGLSIPDTLITNEPALAREFLEHHGPGNVIRKAFRNIAEAPRATAVVGDGDLAMLDAVRYAPVIFQRYVGAELDLRVTIVEDDIFAAAIRSSPDFQVDYREGLASATVAPYTLPDDVAERLLALMRALGIAYGAIDMRVTADQEHVFLEVNPAGEYLFISERTDQPIPAAIAACLERHDQAG